MDEGSIVNPVYLGYTVRLTGSRICSHSRTPLHISGDASPPNFWGLVLENNTSCVSPLAVQMFRYALGSQPLDVQPLLVAFV